MDLEGRIFPILSYVFVLPVYLIMFSFEDNTNKIDLVRHTRIRLRSTHLTLIEFTGICSPREGARPSTCIEIPMSPKIRGEKETDAPIRIEDERDIAHFTLRELLLEWDAKTLEACAGLLDVIYSQGNMTKATAGFSVPVRIALKVGIGLSTVIVGELKNGWRDI